MKKLCIKHLKTRSEARPDNQSWLTSLVGGVLVCLLSLNVQGDTLAGRVVGITDGDTLTLLDQNNVQHKIRLAGIDTPEKAMPWGQKAKEGLSDMAFDRTALIEWDKIDRYRRIIGKVLVDGRDVNLALIRNGLAWHYKKYEKEQSASDRLAYSREEAAARSARRGLWADSEPIPPWEWRKIRRAGKSS